MNVSIKQIGIHVAQETHGGPTVGGVEAGVSSNDTSDIMYDGRFKFT